MEGLVMFSAGVFTGWAVIAGIGVYRILSADLAEDRWPVENGMRNRRGL